MGASVALGMIAFIGAIATIVLYPFVLTYLVAMCFEARGEGQFVDAVLGWPQPAPAGPPAYSAPAAPYSTVSAPPALPYGAPPAADQGQAYTPASLPPQTALTQPAAPEAPALSLGA